MDHQLFFGKSSSKRAREAYVSTQQNSKEDIVIEFGLGKNTSRLLFFDPKHIGFKVARHKYVAKMFEGFDKVLEIGCQEGFGSHFVSQTVGQLISIDFYKSNVDSCKRRLEDKISNIRFEGHDMIDGPIDENFDGAFALDVLEHIDPKHEEQFISNIVKSLSLHGTFICGTPSLESQKYASERSKKGHINCKSGEQLRELCKRFFHNVFMFGMNDEVLHTGFLPMAHYLIALCTGAKKDFK